MIEIISKIAAAYVIGSIPFSIYAGRILSGIDIREHGSGNAGGTNVFRVLGWKAGIIVTCLDIIKGVIATSVISGFAFTSSAASIDIELLKIFCGFSAIIGHIWTIFAGFRGGKGVATAAGMLIALYPMPMVIALSLFSLSLLLTKYVSLSSIIGAITIPVVLFFAKRFTGYNVSDLLYYFSFLIAILILFTHRTNIKRLFKGTENKIGKKKENTV
jgi:acyl phosphate:glycerol-3-phosphate acyltransferase